MADSITIIRSALNFPELGQPTYVDDSYKIRMFRRVPVTDYPTRKVRDMVKQARVNGDRYFGMVKAGGYGHDIGV